MSILGKYPAPWLENSEGCVVDANCVEIITGPFSESDKGIDAYPEVMRLILAAPELLAALKACVPFVPNDSMATYGPIFEARRAYDAAMELIERIEGKRVF